MCNKKWKGQAAIRMLNLVLCDRNVNIGASKESNLPLQDGSEYLA
jgi:hypothetical protein